MADIVMPQLGESVTEGTITRWFKAVGESVTEDEPLFEVSTHFTNDYNGFCLLIVLKHLQIADVIRAGVGIATNPDSRRDPVGELGTDPNNFVGKPT